MKIIKKLILGLLKFCLINLIMALIISFTFKDVLVDGIIKETIKQQISNTEYKEPNELNLDEYINKEEITFEDIVNNEELINSLFEDEDMTELIDDFTSTMIDTLASDSDNKIDIEEKIISYFNDNKEKIKEKTGVEINDDSLEKIREELKNNNINETIQKSIDDTKSRLTTKEITVLKGFNYIISQDFKKLLIVLIIINLILILIVERSFEKLIKATGQSLVTSGISIVVMAIAIIIIIKKLTFLDNVNVNPLLYWGIITTIFGLLMVVISKIINNLKNKEVKENEVS